MPKHRSPVLGFNHNIRHRGWLFHVQTEDSGVANPHLFTHLFHDGVIIATKKMVYDARSDVDVVKGLMQAQHKSVMRELKGGAYDDKIRLYLGEAPPGGEEPAGASRDATRSADETGGATRPDEPSTSERPVSASKSPAAVEGVAQSEAARSPEAAQAVAAGGPTAGGFTASDGESPETAADEAPAARASSPLLAVPPPGDAARSTSGPSVGGDEAFDAILRDAPADATLPSPPPEGAIDAGSSPTFDELVAFLRAEESAAEADETAAPPEPTSDSSASAASSPVEVPQPWPPAARPAGESPGRWLVGRPGITERPFATTGTFAAVEDPAAPRRRPPGRAEPAPTRPEASPAATRTVRPTPGTPSPRSVPRTTLPPPLPEAARATFPAGRGPAGPTPPPPPGVDRVTSPPGPAPARATLPAAALPTARPVSSAPNAAPAAPTRVSASRASVPPPPPPDALRARSPSRPTSVAASPVARPAAPREARESVVVARPSVVIGDGPGAAPAPAGTTRRAAAASPPREMPPPGENIFGHDLISEKSLDEVIMAYLSEDGSDE